MQLDTLSHKWLNRPDKIRFMYLFPHMLQPATQVWHWEQTSRSIQIDTCFDWFLKQPHCWSLSKYSILVALINNDLLWGCEPRVLEEIGLIKLKNHMHKIFNKFWRSEGFITGVVQSQGDTEVVGLLVEIKIIVVAPACRLGPKR